MKEIIVAAVSLLGGGVLVQLLTFFNTARETRRQAKEGVTKTQLDSLEHTINVLRTQMESEISRHSSERKMLKDEIESLQIRIAELTSKIETLTQENSRLLLLLGNRQ